MTWAHIAPAVAAAFLASIVEFVEALTVVLAVGSVRGWRGALLGAGAALLALLVLVAIFGPALALVPLGLLQVVVGTLLLLFGMRWLRKAILRAAGVLALHDEAGAFAEQTQAMQAAGGAGTGFDRIGFAAAFQITMLEGIEVVFIVIAVGAGGVGLMAPAALGAVAALLVVVLLGAVVRKPLSRVPENQLKFIVGVLLSAFGTFWLGEGIGLEWPGDDWSILALLLGFLGTALLCVQLCGRAARRRLARS
jgi:Ca2+/H+ antiporter, TMEM165/GDT1 family